MANNFFRVEKGLNFKGQSTVPSNPGDGDVYFDTTLSALRLYKNGAWSDVGSGSGSGTVKATLYDPVSTSLPTGANPILDGQAVADGDQVFFTNLASDNTRIYQASNVATSVVWTAIIAFNGSYTPVAGDLVYVIKGDLFSNQIVYCTESGEFLINDTVRLFNGDKGTDFVEIGSIKNLDIADGSSGSVFTVDPAGSENWIISFSIVRGAKKALGHIYLTTVDGTDIAVSTTGSDLNDVGISFSGSFDGSDISLDFDSEAGDGDAVLKYWTSRWSDQPGGPSGVPSYSSVAATLNVPGLPPVGSIIAYNPGYYVNGSNGTFTLVGPGANNVAGVNAFLPEQWRVASGAAYNDAASPIWNAAGRFLPNMTDSRFLMGSTAAGTPGGNNSAAHTHSVTSNVAVANHTITQPTFTVNAHNHNIAHAHQILYNNGGTMYTQTSLNAASTTWTTGGTLSFNFANGLSTGGSSGIGVTYPNFNTATYYTGGALAAPSGTGASALSGPASSSATTRSQDVALSAHAVTNNAVTSSAASATENRPLYLSTFYIVRVK